MTAAKHVYGNRGGGWLPGDVTPGEGVADLARLRAEREAMASTVPTGCDTEPADEQLVLFGDGS